MILPRAGNDYEISGADAVCIIRDGRGVEVARVRVDAAIVPRLASTRWVLYALHVRAAGCDRSRFLARVVLDCGGDEDAEPLDGDPLHLRAANLRRVPRVAGAHRVSRAWAQARMVGIRIRTTRGGALRYEVRVRGCYVGSYVRLERALDARDGAMKQVSGATK